MACINNGVLSCFWAIWLLMLGSAAPARTILVGPASSVKTIAAAAQLAKDGDVVEIASGDYVGDVTTWKQKRLTIRGIGQRPVLHAAGRSAEGKAIWVFRNGDFKVSNIELRGARVADGNGAGIRFEKGKLTVIDCAFFDNQNGLLTANFPDAELTIRNSVFALAPKQTISLPHLLYAGRIALLRVTGSHFHGGYRGHLLKSRARVSDIRDNRLVDDEDGSASYEADFPNGGNVTLVGNVIGQSKSTENPILVSFGAEGYWWPHNEIVLENNTLINPLRWGGTFLRVMPGTEPIRAINNRLVGAGTLESAGPGEYRDNVSVELHHYPPAASLPLNSQ